MDDLRYPVGKFVVEGEITPERREAWLQQVDETPARLRAAVQGLSDERLDTPYRDGGWTVRQVIHHMADSHLNAYVRFKLGLTEEAPAIKTYDEARWAELPDTRDTPPEVSLAILDVLHRRWMVVLRTITEAEWARTVSHPQWGEISLDKLLAQYAWHGRHHVAHVTRLRERMGW